MDSFVADSVERCFKMPSFFPFLLVGVAGVGASSNGTNSTQVEVVNETVWTEWIRPALAQILLFVLFTGLAAQISFTDFRTKFTDPSKRKGVIAGAVCQFIVMPALGFASIKLFDVEPVTGSVLLLITSSPGGALSNWVCDLFNADLALSIALTTASSLAAFFMMPINAVIYINRAYPDRDVPIKYGGAALSLCIVIVGVALGLLLGSKYPGKRKKFNLFATIAGGISIVLSVFTSSAGPKALPVWERDSTFYASISFVVGAGLIVGLVASLSLSLPPAQRMSVAIETMYQNLGIAVSASLTMFNTSAETAVGAGVPIFYGIMGAVVNLAFCLTCWKIGWSLAKPSEPLLQRTASEPPAQYVFQTKDSRFCIGTRAKGGRNGNECKPVNVN